ncbi:MAG: eukaryotic-like serine/threonine-protein kinase, partial [Solirubrobacteraceae bacterium]|nr:eukaryotic-like serine/threonine-protein kinase [Solirubrobacteraceae bacterium]
MSRRFGAYEIVEEVGRGGMGVVYHAREMALDRDVALKVILEDSVAVPIFRARFERESRLAASIDHPHIVAVHAVGEHDGRPYIAMQWINGGDLRSRLREGPMSVADAVRVGRQIAEALQAAHERGLLHRDVKPGNVMLRRGSRIHAMLGDFGIARTSEASLELTRTGEVVGTPLYSAPEQFSGAGAQTASDVYSLGCVLYACLTGKAPYADSDNVAVVYMA